MKKNLLVIIILLISIVSFGQEHDHDDHNHEGHEHSSHGHKNEISAAIGLVPIPAENEVTLGLHLHYIKGLGEKQQFGVGLGFETIFDEHKHYTFSVVGLWRVYKGLSFTYAPGIMFYKPHEDVGHSGEEHYEAQFAQHFEFAYEFMVGNFHIGPMVEVGVEQLGVHYMAGVHFGIAF